MITRCRVGLDAPTLDAIRLATNGGFVLGNRRFQDEAVRRLGRRVARGKPGRPATAAAPARPPASATRRRPASEAPTT
ncbi:MAG: hypothetical protein HY246_07550 [Proteobacteria bacterium]|nr:hypothetical protein [Pseudomonadota bacterium]